MYERIIFSAVAISILGVLIAMTYETKSKLIGAMFIATLLVFGAVYLLQFGKLESFSIRTLGTDAKFINEKKAEASAAVEDIRKIREEVESSKTKSLEMEKQIHAALELAGPTTLALSDVQTTVCSRGLVTGIRVTPSRFEYVAELDVNVEVQPRSSTRLIAMYIGYMNIDLADRWISGSVETTDAGSTVSHDGLKAELATIYQYPNKGSEPRIELVTSGPGTVVLSGAAIKAPFIVKIVSP